MKPSVFLLAGALACLSTAPALALDGVVVSIKPLHSLVSAVMGAEGTPRLLVGGNASPHTYALKPSDAAALEKAKLIFWIGPDMEPFLGKPLASLAAKATKVEMASDAKLELLPPREGGTFEHHEHDADHDHEGHAHEGTGDAHEDSEVDMHFWLDPQNAKVMTATIRDALSKADPANAAAYSANAAALEARLDRLTADVAAELAPVRNRPFIVFHDAYQYFENRFGLNVAGSITVSPEAMPGADRISQIHAKVKELGATCVFAEPQFEPRLVNLVLEGTGARAGTLDPEGGLLSEGPDLYPKLVRGISASIARCLAGAS